MVVSKFYVEPVNRKPKQQLPQECAKQLRYFGCNVCSQGYKHGQDGSLSVSKFYLSMLADQINLQVLVTHFKHALICKCKVNRELQNYHTSHSSAANHPQESRARK